MSSSIRSRHPDIPGTSRWRHGDVTLVLDSDHEFDKWTRDDLSSRAVF